MESNKTGFNFISRVKSVRKVVSNNDETQSESIRAVTTCTGTCDTAVLCEGSDQFIIKNEASSTSESKVVIGSLDCAKMDNTVITKTIYPRLEAEIGDVTNINISIVENKVERCGNIDCKSDNVNQFSSHHETRNKDAKASSVDDEGVGAIDSLSRGGYSGEEDDEGGEYSLLSSEEPNEGHHHLHECVEGMQVADDISDTRGTRDMDNEKELVTDDNEILSEINSLNVTTSVNSRNSNDEQAVITDEGYSNVPVTDFPTNKCESQFYVEQPVFNVVVVEGDVPAQVLQKIESVTLLGAATDDTIEGTGVDEEKVGGAAVTLGGLPPSNCCSVASMGVEGSDAVDPSSEEARDVVATTNGCAPECDLKCSNVTKRKLNIFRRLFVTEKEPPDVLQRQGAKIIRQKSRSTDDIEMLTSNNPFKADMKTIEMDIKKRAGTLERKWLSQNEINKQDDNNPFDTSGMSESLSNLSITNPFSESATEHKTDDSDDNNVADFSETGDTATTTLYPDLGEVIGTIEDLQDASGDVLSSTPYKKAHSTGGPSPMLALFAGLAKSADIMKEAIEILPSTAKKLERFLAETEQLLTDTLYSIHYTAGSRQHDRWFIHTNNLLPAASDGVSGGRDVSFSSMSDALKAVFEVDDAVLASCLEKGKLKQAPQLMLKVTVHSAKDLRMKSVAGTINPYVTVTVPGDSQRTRVLQQVRVPCWEQSFNLRIKNILTDSVVLEVWHEYDQLGVGAVRTVKDLKGLGRLVKGTTAPDRHLLGTVTVPLMDIQDGLNSWYPLLKIDPSSPTSPDSTALVTPTTHFISFSSQLSHLKQSGAALLHHSPSSGSVTDPSSPQPPVKQRGELHLSASVCAAPIPQPSETCKPYDALLAKTILSLVQYEPGKPLWSGSIPPANLCVLHLTGLVHGLEAHQKTLALLNVASRGDAGVSNAWLKGVWEAVYQALLKNQFTAEEEETLRDTLASWLQEAETRLAQLDSFFSTKTWATSSYQLSHLLRTLKFISTSPAFQSLLKRGADDSSLYDINELVKRGVERHMSNWWMSLLEKELKNLVNPEEQVKRVISITDECQAFIAEATALYSPVFMSDFGLPYLRIIYLYLTKKLNPCVRPLIMNIYNRLITSGVTQDVETKNEYALSAGTDLWQLYINLGRIHKQGSNMPAEVRNESGVKDYHWWFTKGVMHWLQVTQIRVQRLITKAVEADNLTPCDEYCDFSSSSTDAITVFRGVQSWWEQLSWPEAQHSCILLAKILEDMCLAAIFYCDQLNNKVQHIYNTQTNDSKVFITRQICIGLNNMERVRDDVAKLPELFKLKEQLAALEATNDANPTNPFESKEQESKAAVEHFGGTFDRLVSNASDNMTHKVTEFVSNVVEKVTGSIKLGLTDACEAGSPEPLLEEVLDPGLRLMRNTLQDANFARFLRQFWDVLLSLTREILNKNVDRKNASYFQGVHDILSASLHFFTLPGGLSIDEAMNQEYVSLMELLASLRLSAEALIAQYYQERSEERLLPSITSRGELFVTVFFAPNNKLVVEVVMAKDFKGDEEATSRLSIPTSPLSSSGGPIDPYVKVQMAPAPWFPSAVTYSTKTMKRSDPATFQEIFTYVLSPDHPNVKQGFLLFTLKDHNLARANTFVGEAVVPLSSVPLVESESILCQPKALQLKLTKPGMEAGYKSITTLKMRSSSDKIASAFIKKISSRFQDARNRKESKDSGSHTSDEDKTTGVKTTGILDKFKNKVEII